MPACLLIDDARRAPKSHSLREERRGSQGTEKEKVVAGALTFGMRAGRGWDPRASSLSGRYAPFAPKLTVRGKLYGLAGPISHLSFIARPCSLRLGMGGSVVT